MMEGRAGGWTVLGMTDRVGDRRGGEGEEGMGRVIP